MRAATVVVLQVALIFLMACSHVTAPFGTAVTIGLVSVPAQPPALFPGAATTITATVFDQNNKGVTWTIAPLNFGTLGDQTSTNQASNNQTTASITYTAPTNVTANTTLTITATSISNPNVTASIPIQVTPVAVSLQLVSPLTGSDVPAADQTMNQGEQLTVFAQVLNQSATGQDVTWTLSPATGAGTLTPGTSSTQITYVAPTSVPSPLTVSLNATSVASPAASASMQITVLPSGAGSNVAAVHVDGGPVPTRISPNGAFTSVTICNPGSFTCQTVEGVLVDTGSYGLRVLQSKIPLLKLPTLTDGNSNTLENCVSLTDGSYLWGPVAHADLYVSGELAPSTLIQVISSSNSLVPDGCSNGGTTNQNTPELLGANGILGVGPEPTDCTLAGVNYCDGSAQPTPPNLYYSCPKPACLTTDSPVIVAVNQQVTNPVTLFFNLINNHQDSNGLILQLPPVSGRESAVTGTLTLGIGTDTNNDLGSATVFTLDQNDNFTTIFKGQTLTKSFIDSGSNAIFFPDSLPNCSVNTNLFCPPVEKNRFTTTMGATQGQGTVTFTVDNADDLLSANPGDAAFIGLAGPASGVFNFGLPFFYGRTVFSAIDGKTVFGAPAPPWWAY